MPNRVGPFEPNDTLWIEARYVGNEATIVVEGEFDTTGTEQFWGHVSEAIKSRSEAVIVDGRGLAFIDSSGLMAFVRACEAAVDAGMTFQVRPSPALRRIVELTGLEHLLSHG